LSEPPLPQPAAGWSLSVSEAIKAGFLPKAEEDVVDMLTPSESRLYRNAQDHRYLYKKGDPMLAQIWLSIFKYMCCTVWMDCWWNQRSLLFRG
jgi:hypothetical protein